MALHDRSPEARPTLARCEQTSADSVDPETLDALLGAADTEHEALAAPGAVEAARVLAEALTPDQAQVILLRILVGLTVEEVAVALSKRPGTMRVLQHRALRRLAEKFSLEGVTR